ncbi:hypothetical protein [Aeromonas sobria]|uniref:hypothetical protein n=1 Tax=Aeromonas sobria TaxID=646 RepID=UPI00111A76AA|nr:hypothetical protein [Aeromonas sobria]
MSNRTTVDEWPKFWEIEKSHGNFSAYPFLTGTRIGNVARFHARYSFAADLNALNIKNATPSTNRGYTSLLRLFSVWSALESYFKLFCDDKHQLRNFYIARYDTAKRHNLNLALRALSPATDAFFKFIRDEDNTDSTHKNKINDFLNGNSYDPSYLLSGARHVFGHGVLTPSSGGASTAQIEKISNLLKNFFLDVINCDFNSVVRAHPDY